VWRLVHKITTGLIIALGAVHCVFTARNYDGFTLDAMWFLGSGIAIILAGFLNVAEVRVGGKDQIVRSLCLTANLIFIVLFAAALLSLSQPQVIVGVFLFVVATIAVLANIKR
jgi:hypothetical protein